MLGATHGRLAAPLQINDGSSWFNTYGASPGVTAACQAFQQYKLRGLKIKHTYWPLAPNSQPLCGWTLAAQQSLALTAVTPDVQSIPEQRWGKYRTLSFPGQGTRPTSMTTYYSAHKVWGPDRTETNSVNFTSNTLLASPFFGTPNAGPFYDMGIFVMNGQPATATITVAIKTEVTAYFQFWAKRSLTA